MFGRKSKVALLTFGGFLIFGFQNCGGGSVKFNNVPSSGVGQSSVSIPAPAPLKCGVGFTSYNSACVPCKQYKELTAAGSTSGFLGTFVIPPADQTQTCYYLHVINSFDLGSPVSSSLFLNRRNDIESRNHDVAHANASPHIIGSTQNADGTINTGAVGSAQFTLLGQRTVFLSGSTTGQTSMKVDNYILLEMNSRSLGPQTLAEGTLDAVPWLDPANANSMAVGPITVNGNPVSNYVSFGVGGTTDVNPVDISGYFPLNDTVSVTTTGLDCGGVGDISDIYLLFQ